MLHLSDSIQFLPGVGPKRAELLRRELEIQTLDDLIHFYPFRYVDRSGITPISELIATSASVQIKAKVVARKVIARTGGELLANPQGQINFSVAQRLSILVEDESGTLEIVFFKGIKWNYTRLEPGRSFIFFGKPQRYGAKLNMVHPDVDEIKGDTDQLPKLTGVYPSTESLKNSNFTGKVMCKLQKTVLDSCESEITETLPEYILKWNTLMPLPQAIRTIHFPNNTEELERASYRLKFEELFLLQLSLLKQKYVRSRSAEGVNMPKVGPDFHACYDALPYQLTKAQQRVIKEIRSDIMSGRQMNRLLQGDVGSGKTMVAVLSCLLAWGNGWQSCIMAPTEVLAQQHFANIQKYLAPTTLRPALLTGSSTTKERREALGGLADGSIGIIVGTHALLEDNVVFRNLGFVVIDEQHRFGVAQRAKLWSKSAVPPHILVMTATPIPRTLAMTLYGDLDVSVIDELPPGRKPVQTMCIGQSRKGAMYKFMRDEIRRGRQVFVVYPLIFESEKTDLQNLEKGFEDIVEAFPLPDYKVAIVHGQQSPQEKEFNMKAFAEGRANILVSTTVIEVGVDVPNASVMVIQSAQRFGLSQLHQLRGRVGRGAEKSYCILVKDDKTSKEASARLELMCRTEDGFEIAEEDMKMRGPGDLEGTAQSGLPISLRIASLARDGIVLQKARACAQKVLSDDATLQKSINASLALQLRKGRYEIKDYSKIS